MPQRSRTAALRDALAPLVGAVAVPVPPSPPPAMAPIPLPPLPPAALRGRAVARARLTRIEGQVLGNGDVDSRADALAWQARSGCAGLMVRARARALRLAPPRG